jgi:hypothetical protein
MSLLLLVTCTGGQNTRKSNSIAAEQSHFSAESETVDRPANVTEGVLQVLRTDADVRNVLKAENLRPDQLPSSWFSASEIHLNGPSEIDLIVVAGGRLIGANVTTFWVLRPTAEGYKCVLTVAAHDLTVKSSRSNRLRDIRVEKATAVDLVSTLYRFNGKQYEVFETKTKPIR